MFKDSLYSQFIFTSRYARYIDSKNRRETWSETVKRYFDFIGESLKEKHNYDIAPYYDELYNAVLKHDIMPSMRALMTAGPAAKKNHVALYNCAYLPMDDMKSFDEEMAILMSGTGVGYSVESDNVKQLPELPDTFFESDTTIIFDDSRLGWSKGYREFLSLLMIGQIPKWDVSKLRPAGARLKTMGGRSSGPDPLVELLRFTLNTFKKAAGRRLTTLEAHDIACKVADIVVVGGVRRSALISLSDLNDDRMRDAKSGTWWKTNPYRRLANNSAVYNEKPDMGVFMKEWLSLYESHSGERGIVSRKAIRRVIDNANEYRSINFEDAPQRDTNHEFGVNPCLHPDSMVETIHGRVKIKDIKEPTMVYSMDKNGKLCIRNSSASWISKKKANTLKITISSCKELICTPDHKIYVEGRGWLEAQNIKIGDRVVHLTRNRRGAAYSGVKLTTQTKQEIVMEHRLVFEAYYGKIPVGYDVHHIDGDTYNNDIDNLECLSHEDHARLTGIEQPNNHGVVGYNDKCVNNIGFISPENSRHGAKVIIPIPEDLKSNLHQYANVISIQEGPITDVYDLSVEDTHNFIADFIVVHNCAEIILRPYEFCNLTSVQIYEDDSKQSILNKIKLATILGTFQSCFTDFKYLKKKWQRNCEEERLLGVSLNGVFDNGWTNGQAYENNEFDENAQFDFENFRTSMKAEAIRTNMKVAKEIGINASVAITCIKPEGCISLDTKIKTTEGNKSIASIFGELTSYDIFEMDGGNWITPDRKMYVYDENNEEKEITKLYVNGLSEVYEITMEDNTIVKLTANHQLKTVDGWKKAKDLSENDEILSW